MLLKEVLIIFAFTLPCSCMRSNSCCRKHPPNYGTSSSTFHWLHYALEIQSFFPQFHAEQNVSPQTQPKSIKLALITKVKFGPVFLSPPNMFFSKCERSLLILSVDERLHPCRVRFLSRCLLNRPRQILTLFNTELASNSSCSVEPIPHWKSLHYPVFSCIYLMRMISLFGDLEWICVILNLQNSRNYRLRVTSFSCSG